MKYDKKKVTQTIEEIERIKYVLNRTLEETDILLEAHVLRQDEYDPLMYDSIKRVANNISNLNRDVTRIIDKEINHIYSNYEEIMTEVDLAEDKDLAIEWLYYLINRTASTLHQILDVLDGRTPGMFEEYVVQLYQLQGFLLEDIEEIKMLEEREVIKNDR